MIAPCGKPVEGIRDARTEHRPAAGREEHRASRRGRSTSQEIESTKLFMLLCALIGRELRAHPDLNFGEGYVDLVEHMKTAAAKAHLPYGQDHLRKALDAVEASRRPKAQRLDPDAAQRIAALRRSAPWLLANWRDRCAHRPACQTPTQCALRAAKERA